MSPAMVEMQGTLQADGTLVLNGKPNLPPGPVRVTVQSLAKPLPGNDIISVLERIHAEQKVLGHFPRSKEEIDSEIEAMRQEDEERMQAIERLQEECRRSFVQPPTGERS